MLRWSTNTVRMYRECQSRHRRLAEGAQPEADE